METARLVGPRTGVVRRLVPFPPEAGDPPLVVVGAEVRDTDLLGGAGEVSASGAIGFTRAEAEAAALGEACERYAATFVSEAARRATVGDMKEVVSGWSLFTPRQHGRAGFPFVPWRDDTLLTWVPVRPLGARRKEAWAPAQMVHLPFHATPPESLLQPALSTGLASGATLEDALLAAVYEIVERDAFALMWLHDARPPHVAERDLPPRVQALARYGRFHVFDLTSDIGLPTFLCVLERAAAFGTVRVVGAATRHDADAAIEKAVLEAFQTVPYVRDLVRAEPDWRAGRTFERLRDFRDHARFYTVHPEHEMGLAYFLHGPAEVAEPTRIKVPGDAPARLADAVARLRAVGLEAWWADLTTPDVADCGVHVVRALVPGAQPLHGLYQAPHLGGDRFREAARHLPYLKTARSEEEVNPWPHPFA